MTARPSVTFRVALLPDFTSCVYKRFSALPTNRGPLKTICFKCELTYLLTYLLISVGVVAAACTRSTLTRLQITCVSTELAINQSLVCTQAFAGRVRLNAHVAVRAVSSDAVGTKP